METKIKKFDSFINEEKSSKITLTSDDKKYFWSKIEYNKKKKATDSKNELFEILTSKGDTEVSSEQMIKYLNSLEYSIKKQMKDPDKVFRNKSASSIKDKIPSTWIDVKYSSISAKKKREEKEDK